MSTVVTQTDFSNSVASSSIVSPSDFRRAWITPTPEKNLANQTQYDENNKLSPHTTLTATASQSIDHDDEVSLHPLSNQVMHKTK